MGKILVAKRPIDDRYFSMQMTVIRALLGRIFEYRGKFELNL
jgi:hypothetical protein